LQFFGLQNVFCNFYNFSRTWHFAGMTMLEWTARRPFGRDEKNNTVFVTLGASNPVQDGATQEECHVTVQIPWPEDHSEPSIRQAGLERLRDLVTKGLNVLYDPRAIDR
jgi:hypothetical protein